MSPRKFSFFMFYAFYMVWYPTWVKILLIEKSNIYKEQRFHEIVSILQIIYFLVHIFRDQAHKSVTRQGIKVGSFVYHYTPVTVYSNQDLLSSAIYIH